MADEEKIIAGEEENHEPIEVTPEEEKQAEDALVEDG